MKGIVSVETRAYLEGSNSVFLGFILKSYLDGQRIRIRPISITIGISGSMSGYLIEGGADRLSLAKNAIIKLIDKLDLALID
jgi:hypothetical protein